MHEIQKLSLLGLVILRFFIVGTYAAYDDGILTYPLENLCRRWDHQSVVVKNKLYLLGGRVLVKEALQNGLGNESSTWEGEPSSEFLVLDLSQSFSLEKTDNNSAGLPPWNPIEYSIDRSTPEPLAIASGGMWSKDDKIYVYDGQHTKNATVKDESEIWSYDIPASRWNLEAHWKNPDNDLPNRFTRGTGVNVPQIGMGFFVGGARLYLGENNTEEWKYSVDQQFFGLDIGKGNYQANFKAIKEKRNRKTTGAAVTWIPVGEKGSLLMIGGTDEDEDRTQSPYNGISMADIAPASAAMASTKCPIRAPARPQEVWVYDIAGDKWYIQTTSGKTPARRMHACAVAVSASDNSSHQIFYYGGGSGSRFFGMDDLTYMGDLYILNIPSFQWSQYVDLENPPAARTRHTCHLINNRQMVIVGGSRNDTGTEQHQWCRWDEISVLDLTKLEWQLNYTATTEPYTVNQKILTDNQYNGQPMTAPTTGWASSELEGLFTRKPKDKRLPTSKVKKIAGLELGAFIGVVIGVVAAITLAVVGFLIWKRKKNQRIEKERLEQRNSLLVIGTPSHSPAPQYQPYGQDSPYWTIDGVYLDSQKGPSDTVELPADKLIHELPTTNEFPTNSELDGSQSRFTEDFQTSERQWRPIGQASSRRSSREVPPLSPTIQESSAGSRGDDLITVAP